MDKKKALFAKALAKAMGGKDGMPMPKGKAKAKKGK